MDSHQILKTYIEAASAHGAATKEGNPNVANRNYDKIIAALRLLRSTDEHWAEVLESALTHEDRHVRGWAATHLLEAKPDLAVKVLEELVEQRGIAGFDAMMVLREWRAGRLKLT